ncbi:MAG: GNAT family N-acetyltransferase [Gammaproteobacteria bacterium]|jgi:ElaA protein|nr:GNAT family N-acetyltransferase [Gammaproteobacteria bacterium]MDH5171007.1 GNAT family N-acetyltransferase [Gammaproteobacteria bacterium]
MDHLWQTCEFSGLDILQLYAALRLRQEVFAVEQNCAYLDLDNLDQGAVHMLCWHRDELVAYQRCLAPGTAWPESALGRIVVRAQSRGRQLGRELVERGIRHNLGRWPEQDIRINAQAYLREFYADLGFSADGDVFGEDGIPHIQMVYARSA